jgi:hypothetical protein
LHDEDKSNTERRISGGLQLRWNKDERTHENIIKKNFIPLGYWLSSSAEEDSAGGSISMCSIGLFSVCSIEGLPLASTTGDMASDSTID